MKEGFPQDAVREAVWEVEISGTLVEISREWGNSAVIWKDINIPVYAILCRVKGR